MPYPSGVLYPSSLPSFNNFTSSIQVGQLLLNALDGNGTWWAVTKFSGWGTPKPTFATTQNVRRSGFTAGDSFSEGRVMTLTVIVSSQNPTQHSLDCDTLIGSFSRKPTMFQVSESGRTRWCSVQRSAEIIPNHLTASDTEFTVQVTSKDWRKFGGQLTSATGLPSSSGGYSYPLKYPFKIPAIVNAGQATLTNLGNETGPVWARIDGPCTGPVIRHVGSGAQLILSSALTLNVGEFLLIDMEKRSILANGQASRSAFLTSRGWSGFEPGPNTWQFTASSYNSASLLTVTANPSWE